MQSKEYFKKYNKENAPKRRLQAREYNRRMRESVFDILGKRCAYCGFSDMRALQIDHVNGGGERERKTLKVNYQKFIAEQLLAGKLDYQILCANCNWIKRFEKGEHRQPIDNKN